MQSPSRFWAKAWMVSSLMGSDYTPPLDARGHELLLKAKFRSAGGHGPGEICDATEALAALEPDHSTFEIVAV